MNSQKRNTRNLNLKEENSSRFIFGNYSGLLLKSSFNSVLPCLLSFFLFIFFLSLSNVFFLCHFFRSCTLASARRKGSPSSSWRWQRRFYRRPVDVYHISRIAMTGWALYDMHRATFASFETCSKTYLELPKSPYLIFLYSNLMESIRRFLKVRCSPVEQLCNTWKSTRDYIKITSEVRDIFWSSDLCTQWLMTADVLECSLTLRTPQFNDGARP